MSLKFILPSLSPSSIESLVVPSMSVTIALSSPKSTFITEDFPTFGLPTITVLIPFRIILPVSVESESFVSSFNISDIGWFKSIFTASPSPALRSRSGIWRDGMSSNFSIQIPSLLILHLMLRSAEQLTPIPTGHEAPWRGRRTMRMS